MKTLVIHPDDRSTDFLKLIYADKGFDVITHYSGEEDLIKAIEDHDRIIMMGHGTGSGLFNKSYNPNYKGKGASFIIGDRHADLLKTKETISIWCFSDDFFRKHGIKGFHTGMIISEVLEELFMLHDVPLDEAEILDNMNSFASILHDCIDMTPEEMKEYVLDHYNFSDDVTYFNRKNIVVL